MIEKKAEISPLHYLYIYNELVHSKYYRLSVNIGSVGITVWGFIDIFHQKVGVITNI